MLPGRSMHRQLNSKPYHGRRHPTGRRALACALLSLACALPQTQAVLAAVQGQGAGQNAGQGGMLERRVKAAFLYKFLGYAEFPHGAFADAAVPLTIGVLGADDLAQELARVVAGRGINNRPIVVRQLREADMGAPVHLLFVGGPDAARVGRAVRQAGTAMLVVSECENGLQQGSVINFRIVDERVRFDVSLDAAERNGIRLSSRLLTVANRVQKGAQ